MRVDDAAGKIAKPYPRSERPRQREYVESGSSDLVPSTQGVPAQVEFESKV